jgi:paraquat-inducible protein A
MQTSGLIICEHCDSAHQRLALRRGETARCRRCAAVLQRGPRLDRQQLLAVTVAAAILFALANAFPLVRISLEGLSNEATLAASVRALMQGEIIPIGLVTALVILVAPLLHILLLLWLLGFACAGRRAPGFVACMRTLEALRPWSMLEVCLLGIMVTIVKLAGMLNVAAAPGLWALASLTLLMLLLGGHDVEALWDAPTQERP